MNKLLHPLGFLACLGIPTGRAAATPSDLIQFSLEDLLQVTVVSVAKVEQALQDTAAAVFVITADAI